MRIPLDTPYAPLVLAALYSLADRFAGGGFPALDAKLPGRAVFWGALVCAAAGWTLLGVWGAAAALVWLIYRSPSWSLFGGSATPFGPTQIAATLARHALALPLLALAALLTHHDTPLAAAVALAYACLATLLAAWYGEVNHAAQEHDEPIGGQNVVVELCRGALFGLAVGFVA